MIGILSVPHPLDQRRFEPFQLLSPPIPDRPRTTGDFDMIKLALAAVSLTLIAAPAFARDGSWQVGNDQIHLIYSDIDTGTVAGRATLLARVERSAAKLCDGNMVRSEQRDCIRSVVADAAAKSRNNALTLAMNERQGVALAAR
jgi:UrcA family protein